MATDQIVYIPRPIGFGTTESPALIDSALTTLSRAKVFLRREENDDEDYKISLCVNHASGFIERWCRRKLKSFVATYYVDGTGERSVALPEWPMNSISSASLISGEDEGGSEIDITGVLPHEGGVVTLRDDVFPIGTRNICITADCGYKVGVHDSDLATLELACLILSQVYFVKMNNQAYGATAVGLAGASSVENIANENAPPEVVDIMKNYQRIC